jgi:hypothetical protein
MDDRLRNFYLETCVKKSAPGRLLLRLYDALVRRGEHAEAEKISGQAQLAGAAR